MTAGPALWMHAVTRQLPAGSLAGLTGIGGAPLRAVEHAGLVAVVAPVDLAEYGDEALRRKLEDLPWLESMARTHHAVAEAVARVVPMVPTRLATVYRDEPGLQAMLAQRHADLAAALDRVAGRVEWGVKGYAPADGPVGTSTGGTGGSGDGTSGAGSPGAGTAYLLQRRARLGAREARWQAAVRGAEEVHAVLARHAEAARRHAPQDRRLSGVADAMVLNGAYLVPAGQANGFADLVGRLAERNPSVRLELTGPWPAYSFAAVDEATAGTAAGAKPSGVEGTPAGGAQPANGVEPAR